jgi:hypothetical protein
MTRALRGPVSAERYERFTDNSLSLSLRRAVSR